MKRKIIGTVQNRLGAIDRVMGILSHWGFLPEAMEYRLDTETGYMQFTLTITCDDDHRVEKLVKAIQKQVCVIQARQLTLFSQSAVSATLPTTRTLKAASV